MPTNQNKHNKLRFLNIFLGIPAVLISFFLPSKKGRIIINSHFNTKFDYNSKYLFLYMLKQNYDVWFVINDDEFRAELIKIYGNHFIETNSFKGKIFALRSKLWFVSAFEMPVGGAFFKYFRKVIHLTHGSLLKNVGLLEKDISFVKKIYYKFFIRTNISYSIATSHFFVPSTAGYIGISPKNILITGFPRNDALFTSDMPKPEILQDESFKILYAPTWRKDSKTEIFPFENVNFRELNEFLKQNNITIFIRLHPVFENELNSEILGSNIKLFSGSVYSEIMDYMSFFDGLITDYSSIGYDFLLLDRAMMFLPYDYDEYERNVGFAVDYDFVTPGFKPKTLDEFKNALIDMATTDSFKEKRREICNICNTFKNGNCERVIKTLQNLGIEL